MPDLKVLEQLLGSLGGIDLETKPHLSDPDVVRAVPCGTGEADYASFFGGLKAVGYRGYVAYEMCEVLEGGGSIENLDRTARALLSFLEQLQD